MTQHANYDAEGVKLSKPEIADQKTDDQICR